MASCQLTQTAGCRSVCEKPGLLQLAPSSRPQILVVSFHVKHQPEAACPVACTNTAHSPRVTSCLPSAKGLTIETRCCGASLPSLSFSISGEPIVKAPPGTTTNSGQLGQSRNTAPG